MRTTVTIDDELFDKALEMADPNMDRADIFREVFKTFIRVQAAKRLIALAFRWRCTALHCTPLHCTPLHRWLWLWLWL